MPQKSWNIQHNRAITSPEELLNLLLKHRNIACKDTFLNPLLRTCMPDPSTIPHMDEAVIRTVLALSNNENIAILGDYDVDGGTSTALLSHYLRKVYTTPFSIIPHRLNEGYGPKNIHIDIIKQRQVSLLFIVDCGTASYDIIAYAQNLGIDVVVLDHHTPNKDTPLPPLCVNPLLNEDKTLHSLCAAGVTFMFLVALQRALRAKKKINLPDLLTFLDLVAVGTICDVVPLLGLNRAFVRKGLQQMKHSIFPGLKALVAKTETATATDVGFRLGPTLNAGSRMGEHDAAARLLSEYSHTNITNLCTTLINANQQRKEHLNHALNDAFTLASAQEKDRCILLHHPQWSAGILGLIAARVAEHHHKPTWVIASCDPQSKGAARSPDSSIHLAFMIQKALKKDIILAGGGHQAAAGFSIDINNIKTFKAFLEETTPLITNTPYFSIDAPLPYEPLASIWQTIEQCQPFGHHNPEPLFVIHNMHSVTIAREGPKHISFSGKYNNQHINMIAFCAPDSPLRLLLKHNQEIHCIGSIRYFNGHYSLQVYDAKTI